MTEYKHLCWNCGESKYDIQHSEFLSSITVSLSYCDQCGGYTGIIPARDWKNAVEGISHPESWD